MYYIRIRDDIQNDVNSETFNSLIYYCRKCGDEDKPEQNSNVSVYKRQIKKTNQTFNNIINQYTKLDPTLPRINTVLCPNNNCDTNNKEKSVEKEIIYIRYDDINMKYIYLCSFCDTVWETILENNENNENNE